MRNAPIRSKVIRHSTSASLSRPIAGPSGIAIAPPTYGINFVDQQRSTDIGMTIQRQAREDSLTPERQQENRTGLPDQLKTGIETLSGLSMDDVRVHYRSSKPAELQALAYTQGTDIHVGLGQEQHLPHEAWHVVQQAQGRVRPTMQMKDGVPINDDKGLEHEADVMGTKALQMQRPAQVATDPADQAATAGRWKREPTEASDGPGAAIGASGEKGLLNFLPILLMPSATVQRKGEQPIIQRRATFTVKSYTPGKSGVLDLSDVVGAQFTPQSAEYESKGKIQINADSDLEAQDWYAGHVQTIYKGAIKTKFKNGAGAVKVQEIATTETARDGDAGDGPWYDTGAGGKVQFPSRRASVDVELWDQPQNPVDWNQTDKLGNAVGFASMEGKDTFGTWIIARNERTKSKEYLAWETWHVNWGIESNYWSDGIKVAAATTGKTVKTGSGSGKGKLTPEYRNSSANDDLKVKVVKI